MRFSIDTYIFPTEWPREAHVRFLNPILISYILMSPSVYMRIIAGKKKTP